LKTSKIILITEAQLQVIRQSPLAILNEAERSEESLRFCLPLLRDSSAPLALHFRMTQKVHFQLATVDYKRPCPWVTDHAAGRSPGE
jgi:hypothetical protein